MSDRGGQAPVLRKKARTGARSARAFPSHAFNLKQDGQDVQDGQDEEAKVWKTLMSIETPQQQGEKVREDLNRYRRAAAL